MTKVVSRIKWLFASSRRAVSVVLVISVVLISLGVAFSTDRSENASTTSPTTSTTEHPTSSTVHPEQLTATLLPSTSGGFRLESDASTDFPGDQLDTSRWDVYDGAGNQGVGYRRATAISQTDGELKITGRGDVSGGVSQTRGQTYGRWVVRAKMDKGQGYGPAILLWPDSERWPQDGEIDFLEIPDGQRTQAVMSVHYGDDNLQLSQTAFGDFSQWHTYAVDWLPDRVVFYIDGVERYRVTDKAAIPTQSMHLAIQNDIGACDSWIGCRNSQTPDEVALHVSSVRVYSHAG